ncbi:Uncharacterised protein [Neisseria meningitidis]|nr:Uncharacterised protein [Neisseria meningitidis]CWN43700.1 Uncharacterised protein [Neisseria meningitidis]CWO16118.1 Uncharacterised protein [Neisseria meningitidis]CWP38360.1 Uncharacterised protein [Neisseria meningitidis]CWQ58348.1 Uncharacterised protein [Neisseria meningitidis]
MNRWNGPKTHYYDHDRQRPYREYAVYHALLRHA